MNLWRNIMINLDTIVFGAVQIIFQLIMDLADLEIFTESVINEFSSRIYIILGLIMLFKIMFSFIQILVDPDKMSDKEKGAVGVLKRVVISLVLIVMVPSIFDLARQVQSEVIPIIPKVILGAEADLTDEETMDSVGRTMEFYSFLPFFYYDNAACNDGTILGTGTEETEGNAVIWSVDTAVPHVNDSGGACAAKYKYNYRWLLSTAVGVYLIYILVFVAISIAVRAIKLAICEFVAPISIASYIDPKTSKQAFDNWVSTSIKTYLDLFIRLIVVYFVIFVFMTVFKDENLAVIYSKLGGSTTRGIFVTLFIILALVNFIKEAPKFITGLLGIKDGGDIMGMFKGAGSLFAASTKGIYDVARSNYVTQKERATAQGKKLPTLRGWGSAIAGMGSSVGRSLFAAARGKTGKDMRDATFGAAVARRDERIFNRDNKYSFSQRYSDKRRQALKIPSSTDYLAKRPSVFSEMLKPGKALIDYGNQKKEEKPDDLKVGTAFFDNGQGKGKQDDLTLGALRKMSEREIGKSYIDPFTGQKVRWDERHASKITQWISDAEKNSKYVMSERLVGKEDNIALQHADDIRIALKKNRSMFNDTVTVNGKNYTTGELFLSAFEKTSGIHYDNIDKFYEAIESNSNITSNFLMGYKDGFETLTRVTNVVAQEAKSHQKPSN